MEVSKRQLKLKMNMFVKRQNQGQMMPSSSDSSSPPCSCACWEMTQQLNEKVRSLAMQMEKYGRLMREFEEIRGELLWEARGSPVDDDDKLSIQAREKIKQELEYDLEGLSDNLSVTEVEPEDDQDNEGSQCGNGNDSQYDDPMDCVIVESVSLASTPDWPSSGSIPGYSGNSRSSGVLVAAGDSGRGHGHNDTDNSNWGSFEEHLAASENSMNSMSEQGDQVNGEQAAGPKRKRRKRGGGNSGTPTSSLPDESLICPHCATGHVFKERASLRRHIQHFHAEERKTYDCVECNRTFQYKEGLAYHMRSVHEGIRHLCGVGGCTSAYSTITALRKHQRVVGHTGDGVMIRINDPGTYAMYKPEWERENN